MKSDVVIIGAGVVGLSTALRLARSGARVTLLEATDPGGRGSRAAAGVAVPSVRLWGDTAMLEFTRQARDALAGDLEALPDPGSLRRGGGILRIAPDERTRDELQARCEADPQWLGRWVERAELESLEPVLAGTPLLGAFLSEQGFMVDTDAYLNALLHQVRLAGAEVGFSEPVLSAEEAADRVQVRTATRELQADRVVLCGGAWSGGLPGLPRLPVKPLRGQMVTLSLPGARLQRVISGPTYLGPWRAGQIVVGATEEDAGFADHPTTSGMLQLLAAAARISPALRAARFHQAWAGLRSATPDGRPLIGAIPTTRRCFVGTGHGGQGILTGGLTGTGLAELLSTGKAELLEPFSPARALDHGV
jgi:glycine oxidase